MPARQADSLGRQDEAHHGIGQRIACAYAVREHQVALQFSQAFMRNFGAGELSKTGVNAIDHLVFLHDTLHCGLGRLHACARCGVEAQGNRRSMDAAHIG